jgi:hypothetical protein
VAKKVTCFGRFTLHLEHSLRSPNSRQVLLLLGRIWPCPRSLSMGAGFTQLRIALIETPKYRAMEAMVLSLVSHRVGPKLGAELSSHPLAYDNLRGVQTTTRLLSKESAHVHCALCPHICLAGVASQLDPIIKTFYEQLLEKRKTLSKHWWPLWIGWVRGS